MKKLFLSFFCISTFIFFNISASLNTEKNLSDTPKYKIAIFDFCNCFSNKNIQDILLAYRKEANVSGGYFDLIKYGIQYTLGTLKAKKGYEAFFKHCKKTTKKQVKQICKNIWKKQCQDSVFKKADKLFKQYKKHGTITILVDSGIEEVYYQFLKSYKFDHVICTSLKFDSEGLTTGKLLGEPCSGKEKLKRVKDLVENKLNLKLEDAVFYANSINDRFLIEKVKKTYIVNPSKKLKRFAIQKNLDILYFTKILNRAFCKV